MTAFRNDNAAAAGGRARDEAVAWMLAAQDGELNGEDRAAFDRWLDAEPDHRHAWDQMQASLAPFRIVERVPGLGDRLVERIKRQRSRRGLLGVVPLIAGTAAGLAVTDRFYPLDGLTADVSTRTAERASVMLPDGSRLQLNARSRADLDYAAEARGLTLREGKALVTVRVGDAPFRLRAGDLAISLHEGTAMAACRGGETSAICLSGRAALDMRERAAATLHAGEGYRLRDGLLARLAPAEMFGASAWADGRLVLQDRTLAEMVEGYRPYRAGLISLGASAATRRVGGVFDLAQFEQALDMVRKVVPIQILAVGPLLTRIALDRDG